MSKTRRVLTIICFTIAALAAGVLSVQAQDVGKVKGTAAPATSKPGATTTPATPSPSTAAEARRRYDPARRVPPYFGQIGLNSNQRESIYKIRSKHQTRIDELEKQIATAQADMLTECEGVLTETQKKLLENLRTASPGAAGASAATADVKSSGSK